MRHEPNRIYDYESTITLPGFSLRLLSSVKRPLHYFGAKPLFLPAHPPLCPPLACVPAMRHYARAPSVRLRLCVCCACVHRYTPLLTASSENSPQCVNGRRRGGERLGRRCLHQRPGLACLRLPGAGSEPARAPPIARRRPPRASRKHSRGQQALPARRPPPSAVQARPPSKSRASRRSRAATASNSCRPCRSNSNRLFRLL